MIKNRIHEFLDEVQYNIEFSHKILHEKDSNPVPPLENNLIENANITINTVPTNAIGKSNTEIKLRGVNEGDAKIMEELKKIREMNKPKEKLVPPQKAQSKGAIKARTPKTTKETNPHVSSKGSKKEVVVIEDFKVSPSDSTKKMATKEIKKTHLNPDLSEFAPNIENIEEDINRLTLHLIKENEENSARNQQIDKDMNTMIEIMKSVYTEFDSSLDEEPINEIYEVEAPLQSDSEESTAHDSVSGESEMGENYHSVYVILILP